ncbi:MAG: beta-ketoacyl-[acyl-carrier-protein] synthase II [Candidatus Dadabacteria bacterium RIFCSPHIGHO2_12_FULL_53_21]|nr:MAG: beta-ketoacyl-[acyl-carrier-protein] synthase II [Candidatus Dadabacteria bacterium RIFCSPHIGHO2_12_FULL_53_21]
MKRRVAVTGVGLVTPLGIGNKETWDAVCAGRSGVRRVTKFDPTEHKTQIAAEIHGFDPELYMNPKEARKTDAFIQYAVASAKLALDDSGLEITEELSPLTGTIIGSGIGGMETYVNTVHILAEKGPGRLSPFFITNIINNMAAGYVSIFFNAKGPNCCTTTACAASAHAIGYAAMAIRNGEADVMFAGGTEAPIIPLTFGGFNAMRALSTRNDAPERASRPFDKERDGFIIGEGSGMLILEELEFAKKRGARIYAEIVGYGMSSDASHITAPSLDGPERCMLAALKNGGINLDEIEYINAHGTSTQLNDSNETNAIKKVFGQKAYKIPVSSTKSMTGHLLGAAGAVEAAFTVLALDRGILPPTINHEFPDPECDLDYVPNEARKADIKTALSNSFGFGGTNASLIFRKLG